MERQAVRSREIAIVGYEPETSSLEIAFRRGGVYLYQGVPSDIHDQLMAASSIGTYFSKNIKEKFEFQKIS